MSWAIRGDRFLREVKKKTALKERHRERTKRRRVSLLEGADETSVMLRRSYFWHQAQVFKALARECDDPILKQRYEDWALELSQNAGSECDLDLAVPPLATLKLRNPDSGDGNPRE
jgi:hypothetical protein